MRPEVLLSHDVPCRPGNEERTLEMDVHERGEPVLGHLVERRITDRSGVVDENVDATPGFERGVDDRLAALGRRHAVGVGHGFTAALANLCGGVAGGIGARPVSGHRPTEIVDDDAGPAVGEKQRVPPAQSPARAGDHGDLTVEPQFAHYLGQSSGRGW